MKKTYVIACISLTLFASCVSSKKYKLLEADYQKAGEAQRSYEQDHKILQVDLQDVHIKLDRLFAENRTLNSTNDSLRQIIINKSVTDNWKSKYEELLEKYEKKALIPEGKMRGADDTEIISKKEQKLETQVTKKTTKTPPPIVKLEKAYTNLETAKEVKMPVVKPDTIKTIEVVKPDTAKTIELENVATTKLNSQIQKVFDSYKVGEDIQQNQKEAQIALTFTDELLFDTSGEYKLSRIGEELLSKLVYTFSQYPNLTIDLISEGAEAEIKSKKIANVFAAYKIKTRILAKNSMPLAFETTGTNKAVNSLILNVE